MATASTITHARRRKQTTYGRGSRNATAWNVSALEEEEDELGSVSDVLPHQKALVPRIRSPVKSPAFERPRVTVKETYRIEKREQNVRRLVKPATERKIEHDDWDVPSSDEEVGNSFMRRVPPKLASRPTSVSVVEEKVTTLAPWEKKQTAPIGDGVAARQAGNSTELQMRAPLHDPTQNDHAISDHVAPSSATPSPRKAASPGGSAIERLKARRGVHSKRAEDTTTDANPQPTKRIKPDRIKPQPDDHDMEDAPTSDALQHAATDATTEADVSTFDVEANIALKPRTALHQQAQRLTRRGKLASVAHSLPRTITSAPARLTEMLLDDSDSTEGSSHSPTTSLSRPATPQRPAGSGQSLRAETAKKPVVTPRQDQMWKQLLSEKPAGASPSLPSMQALSLQSTRRTIAQRPAILRTLNKCSSDVGPSRQRTRLVDQLRASAPSSESEEDESRQAETEDDDVEMSDDDPIEDEPPNSQSQSQSQRTVTYEGGPKITYSRVRSYLPEDNFEDGLMLSLPEQSTTFVPKKTTKSKLGSQGSAFDFPTSDDEEDGGRLRTVHELRAAGGNQRFIDETSGLLDDIAAHDSSARSRRRSALIELARKFLDSKPFVEKFFRQGFEQKLLAELRGPSDDIADFVLAVASAALLREDSPEHVAQSYKECDAVAWFTRSLTTPTDVRKLAKDRRFNMSKSAQSALVEFAEELINHETFWDGLKPAVASPRTIALKALDNLFGKLRRGGDRSELAERHEVQAIVFSQHELTTIRHDEAPTDLTLSISALERLASLSIIFPWAADVLPNVGQLLVMPVVGSEALKHLRFLALRLCLSLTHDNIRGCKQLAKFPVVRCLFGAISNGFRGIAAQVQAIDLDLLVLEMGVIVNLTEHAEVARQSAAAPDTEALLVELVHAFSVGQKQLSEAETEEETVANVAYGYLAVVLAILCRNRDAKLIIAANLPRKNLDSLIEAVAEFVEHHRRVDHLALGGAEGGGGGGGDDVWSAFTEKLKVVLDRLQRAALQN